MSSHPTPPTPETLAALHAQDALHFRGVLLEMVDLGAELARASVQLVKAAAESAEPASVAAPVLMNAYNGVTRSIRRSMLLAQKFTEPAKPPVSEEAAQKRIAMRKAIIRRVEDTIHREAKAAEAADLHAELLERIESPEFDDDLTQRPAAEIIKDLCADLGLGPDSLHWWKRRTPQDIAILCARAAAPCRDRTGPFNLPMPPRGWDGGVRPYGDAIPPIRGP